MGQQELTPEEITAAVVESIRRVVPRDVPVSASTPLNRTTLDSLGLIEMMVHLEDLVSIAFDEARIRQAVLGPEFDPAMPVAEFGRQLWRLAGESRLSTP